MLWMSIKVNKPKQTYTKAIYTTKHTEIGLLSRWPKNKSREWNKYTKTWLSPVT